MAKTLALKVKVPGLSVSHDFLVPADMVIHKVNALIIKLLQSEYPSAMHHSANTPTLLQASSGLALDRNCTLEQLGVLDGDTFILL